jgi:adenylate kinase family enzyme
MSKRIHILGASGSGTTTLGSALAACLGCPHFDTDDYFWLPTDPPFQQARSRTDRQALLGTALARHEGWVLSGSLCGWGDLFIPLFDVVVFLWVPPDMRLARLQERERQRYGDHAIAPGGPLQQAYTAFIAWAAAYESGDLQMRSRQRHEQWLRALSCPVVRLEGQQPVEESLARVIQCVSTLRYPAEGWQGAAATQTQSEGHAAEEGVGT